MSKRSGGSSIGGFAGLVLILGFFLPWIRSCAGDLSGYDLARNKPGVLEEAWVYWLTLLTGLVCVGVFILVDTNSRGGRIGGAITRLVVALAGVLPLISDWLNVRQQVQGLVEILPGAYLVALGYLGIIVSAALDLVLPGQDVLKQPPDDYSTWY